jgi:hypothetical protein
MDIDEELSKIGLQRITNFYYVGGDYLFDAILYLLKYAIHLAKLYKNSMAH